VQAEHGRHEGAALEGRLGDDLCRAGVDRDRLVVFVVRMVAQGHVPDRRLVRLLRHVHHDLVRIQGAAGRDHVVEIGARSVRRHHGRLDIVAQQVADFVVIDQRQARQAQQEHEDGADQAAPFVDPGPEA
jgi:hypothetical protein